VLADANAVADPQHNAVAISYSDWHAHPVSDPHTECVSVGQPDWKPHAVADPDGKPDSI
jgi:hypothetical protein